MAHSLNLENEKELFQKLITFVKNPSQFYEKNNEKEDTLLDFMTFIIRLSAIIGFIIDMTLQKYTLTVSIIILILIIFLLIFLARIFAIIGLWIGSAILNFFVKLFSKKDDVLAAKRVVAYASVTSLISEIPMIGFLAIILSVIFYTIGISKQYKLSLGKSFVISVAPIVIIFLIVGLILAF